MKFKQSIALVLAMFFVFSFSSIAEITDSSNYIPASSNSVSQKMLIPDGRCVGVVLSTNGALVVDFLDVESADKTHPSPAKVAGLKPGDLIQKLGNKKENRFKGKIKQNQKNNQIIYTLCHRRNLISFLYMSGECSPSQDQVSWQVLAAPSLRSR